MSLGLTVNGGFWDTNSSYDQPVYPETVTRDIATQSQQVSTTPSNDGWTGLLQSTWDKVLNYSLQKDAVQTNAGVQKSLQTPVYVPTPAVYPVGSIQQTQPAISANMVLMIGAGVALYLALK